MASPQVRPAKPPSDALPKEWWLRRKDAPKPSEEASPDARRQEMRLREKLAELEAEADEIKLNQDAQKQGFNRQYSADSTVSGATTRSLAELSSPEFFSRQCSEIDQKASKVVFESKIKDAFRAVVADCQFCVTIADPRDPEIPLIAVSDQFEAITGYSKSEIIGKNCSCLRLGCMSDPLDLICMRAACKTGASFTAVLTNRRKTGELFFNLLDLRGLTVAQNPWTGEELWFLVGIQADITHVAEEDSSKEEHLPKLQEIAGHIRAKLVDELKVLAVAGALMTNFEGHADLPEGEGPCQDAWCILPEPTWKLGGHLRSLLSLSPLLVDPVLSSFGTPTSSSVRREAASEELEAGRRRRRCEEQDMLAVLPQAVLLASAGLTAGLLFFLRHGTRVRACQ